MCKKELRRQIRERKRQCTQDELGALSLSVMRRLMNNGRLVAARTLLLYYPLPDEADVSGLLDMLQDKTLLLPRVTGESTMELRVYEGRDCLDTGAYGIMEPCGPVFTDYGSIDVAVVPGMAFDADGNRLGRGKGYYDRFLAPLPHIYKIGVCFPFQLLDSVPAEPTDIRMDEVVC